MISFFSKQRYIFLRNFYFNLFQIWNRYSLQSIKETDGRFLELWSRRKKRSWNFWNVIVFLLIFIQLTSKPFHLFMLIKYSLDNSVRIILCPGYAKNRRRRFSIAFMCVKSSISTSFVLFLVLRLLPVPFLLIILLLGLSLQRIHLNFHPSFDFINIEIIWRILFHFGYM